MARTPASRTVTFFLLAVGGFAADLASKNAVFARLGAPAAPGERGGTTGWLIDRWLKFEVATTFNEGALWGVGQGWTALFALLSIAAVTGVFYWLFWAGAARSRWLTVALGLITAGTLGNLWDRAGMHGLEWADGRPVFAVRDFLHFRFGTFDWAIFNFADVFLVTGAIMLALQSFKPEPKPAPAETPRTGAPARSPA
jgi:signal peptidase II